MVPIITKYCNPIISVKHFLIAKLVPMMNYDRLPHEFKSFPFRISTQLSIHFRLHHSKVGTKINKNFTTQTFPFN